MRADPETVTVRVDGDVHERRDIDLTGYRVDGQTVARAVRTERPDEAAATHGDRRVRVACPEPRPVHEHVGLVSPSASVAVRTALAAAARSRGLTVPQDDELRTLRDRLASIDDPERSDLTDARRRLAGTASSVERLRERVATLRGRVQAGRDAGRDVSDLERELANATRRLSEQETERAAAREALEGARRRARDSRDARDRRRRLEDRIGNVERAARAHLVDAVRGEFVAAVAALPNGDTVTDVGEDSDPFATDDVTAALAVARVADLGAPLVLACDRFASPARAVAWLDAPVIRASPSE